MDNSIDRNNGLTLFQEVHRALLTTDKTAQPIITWAYKEIHNNKHTIFPLGDVTTSQNATAFVRFWMERVMVVAMPILALVSAVSLPFVMPVMVIFSIIFLDDSPDLSRFALAALKSLGLFFASIALMPIAFVAPRQVYLLNHQWNSMVQAYQTLDNLDNTLASFQEEPPSQQKVKEAVQELSKNIGHFHGDDQISKATEAMNKLNDDFIYLSNDEKFINAKLKLEMASLANNLSSLNKNSLAESIRESLHSDEMSVYTPRLIINKELDTYDNKVPNFIWNMRYLTCLNVGDVGYARNVKGLSELKNSIPPEIAQLTNLEQFGWTRSDLTSLPAEIGRLSNLRVLSVAGNPNLESLPLSLGQIPSLIYIDIEGTKIPQEQCNAILAQCKALREPEVAEQLATRLESWKVFGNTGIDLSGVANFDTEKKVLIDEWIRRLEITKDFNGTSQKSLAETVCQILNSVANDEAFRELFFVQINVNNERCGDRAGMALNEIYTVWKFSQLPSEASVRDKLEIMHRGAMTLALRAAIASRIDQHQKQTNTIELEAAQIYLYYEVSLKEELNLLSAIETMLYEEIGKRDWIDRASLIDEVNKNYFGFLMGLPVFKELIEKDSGYIPECETHTKPLKDKINDLSDKEPQGVDLLSSEHLDWQHQIGELNTQINTIVNNITKKWVKDRLSVVA